MDTTTITKIFQRFKRKNPHPTTELHYRTPFELLVAVILSAQATDASVNLATKKLFTVANTPAKMADLGLAGVKPYIKSIGLYQAKAKYLIEMSKQLIEKHHGKVPDDRKALEALPGVGRKTANVILNTVFHEPVIAVDTHILRVSNRIGLAKGKTPVPVEAALMKRIPARFIKEAHHWLVLHGRYTCKARKPLCGECLIQDLCEYPYKTV